MNIAREELKKHWKEIKAFKNGEQIQTTTADAQTGWVDTEHPRWILHYNYRVKPESSVKYLNIYEDGSEGGGRSRLCDCIAHADDSTLEVLKITITKGEPITYECAHRY